MNRVDQIMQEGLREHVFPGAAVLAAKDNTVLFLKSYGCTSLSTKQPVSTDTCFDLASLTKPLATTPAVMKLVRDSRLDLNQKIKTILPPFDNTRKGSITIKQLLTHTAGLPDYRPYYKRLEPIPFDKRRSALRGFLVEEPLDYPPGQRTVYSDLGFMILSWIIETISGSRLDRFLSDEIYTPLGLNNLFFVDVRRPDPTKSFAATEACAWRKQVIQGVVHDENAYAAGGIEGHAGLFGTATEVYRLLSVLMNIYHGRLKTPIFDPDLTRLFLTKHQGFERAFGFDTPSDSNSSCGTCFSENTVGHLGFAGTSFWMDVNRCMFVILLTIRIHPTRTNEGIRVLRPRLHDAGMQAVQINSNPE